MIESKAKDLGRLIGQSPEYQAVKRANDALSQDTAAVALLKQMEKDLDTLLGQVQGQMAYQRLVSAQENFDKLMTRVNDWIVDGIEKGATSSIITLG